MAHYESDHTRFMNEWLKNHPEEIANKDAGRALWWDKEPLDADTVKRLQEARVPQKAYYYDAN